MAAAIQIVLVSGDPSSVSAENVAIAINYECSECETMAAAYQFVFGDGQEVQFTKEGKQQLHDLKKRFQDLKQRDDLTLEELAAEIAVIAGEVAVVVDTEVEVKKAAEAETTRPPRSQPPPPRPSPRLRPPRLGSRRQPGSRRRPRPPLRSRASPTPPQRGPHHDHRAVMRRGAALTGARLALTLEVTELNRPVEVGEP